MSRMTKCLKKETQNSDATNFDIAFQLSINLIIIDSHFTLQISIQESKNEHSIFERINSKNIDE